MKKIISFSLLGILFIQTTWAQQSCPLTNSKLTDLRVAASKLAVQVSLSSRCKAFEESVNNANSELKSIAEQVAKNGDILNDPDGDKEALALKAVTQLDTIGSMLKDSSCGEELSGFLGYVDTFLDVVTGITPFLALYGGTSAMPWVLGSALGGAAVKSLISFFQNRTINMRDPEQSNAFIKNSCSFYNLDLIKNSIDDLELNRFTQIEQELEDKEKLLDVILSSEPAKPDSDLIQKLKIAKEDEARLGFLNETFKRDTLEACSYIEAFANKSDGPLGYNLVDRIWDNYEVTFKDNKFRMELEKNYFFNNLNQSLTAIEASKCKDLASRWLTKVQAMSGAGLSQLEEKVAKQPDVLAFEKWQKDKKEVETQIKVIEAKITYLNEMKSDGFNIEYSEIIRSHQSVQDSIFESFKYMVVMKMKGLAESWLRVKQEDAHKDYNNFFSRKKQVEQRISKIKKTIGVSGNLTKKDILRFADRYQLEEGREHAEVHKGTVVDVCNQLRQTWSAWYNGLVHAEAGRNYCITFDKVINRLDYPEVQRLCFGTSSRIGHKHNSLKNQVRDFKEVKGEADEIITLMNTLSCEGRGALNEDLLKLALE